MHSIRHLLSVRRTFQFLSLLACGLCLMGCAALGPVLSVIDHAVSDSEQVLKVIETTYNVYQTQHPVSPEEHAEFEKLLANAYAYLNTGTRALADAHDVDQGKYDAAYADFKTAYAALSDYLKAHHVSPIGTGIIGASQNGGADFPTPEVIGLRVKSSS